MNDSYINIKEEPKEVWFSSLFDKILSFGIYFVNGITMRIYDLFGK